MQKSYVISRYFGNEVFADFSNGAIEFPVATLLIGASTTVLTPLFSKKAHEGGDYSKTILPIWTSTFKKSCMILYPLLVFCIFEAKPIMTLLYGAQYENSGYYFIIKMAVNFVKVIPFAAILIAIGSVRFYSRVMMFIFFILAALEYVSVLLFPHNPYILVIIHSLLMIMQVIIYLIYVAKYMNIRFNEKVDEWAAGIIMYNMLTGADPFTSSNDSDYRDNIKFKEINFNYIKNESLRELNKKLLNRFMTKRISAKEALEEIKKLKNNFNINNNIKNLLEEKNFMNIQRNEIPLMNIS